MKKDFDITLLVTSELFLTCSILLQSFYMAEIEDSKRFLAKFRPHSRTYNELKKDLEEANSELSKREYGT